MVDFSQARRIKQIGQSSIILQPSIKDDSLGYVQSAVKRTQNIRQITQKLPEIAPGVSLLHELAQTSEIINAITSRHDPTTSTLFAFGKARDGSRKHQKRHSKAPDVPILAAVGGPARNAVRLLRLGKEELDWGEGRDDGLNILAPRNEEQGWWYGNGSPITQLCFGQAEGDSSSWLAVRYHGATTILRPLLLPGAVPVQAPYYLSFEGHHQSTCKIDPKPIITLPIQKTGFYPHADVCFNPWNSLQFAIIDQQGNWSIWELERSSNHRRIWSVKAGPKGTLSENDADDTNSVDADDTNSMDVDVEGWGKILWVTNGKTIAVVNRRLLLIASLEEPVKYFAAPDLSLAKSDDWILDVKPSPLNKTHLFITTSTRVFWLRVSPTEESQAKRYSASVLLCWRHFRDLEDTSLQMNVLKDEQSMLVSHC